MKINQTIGALALALGVTSVAQAQTPVYITGSTAFRQQVFNGLSDLGLTVQQGKTGGKNSFTYSGTVSDVQSVGLPAGLVGQYVQVFCTFSGSIEGLEALITPGAATYDSVGSSGSFSHTGVDLAFSDILQGSSQVANDPDQLQEEYLTADGARAPFGGVAVQPFAFIANKAAISAGVTNVIQYNFLDTYENGGSKLSFYTGNSSDASTKLLPVGRYNLSGTRATAELDNGDTIADSLFQFALASNNTVSAPPGLASTDSTAPNGDKWVAIPGDTAGTNGYFTGGNVGVSIDNSSANNSVYYTDSTHSNIAPAIGYISFADAQSKLNVNGSGEGVLNWLGEYPGTKGNWNINGVKNGTYQFFSYERLYVADGDQGQFIDTTFAPGLIQAFQYEITHTSPRTAALESEMNVYRNGDGGDVYHY